MKNLNLVQLDVQKLHIDEMKALNGGVAPALLVGGGAVGVSVAGGVLGVGIITAAILLQPVVLVVTVLGGAIFVIVKACNT